MIKPEGEVSPCETNVENTFITTTEKYFYTFFIELYCIYFSNSEMLQYNPWVYCSLW